MYLPNGTPLFRKREITPNNKKWIYHQTAESSVNEPLIFILLVVLALCASLMYSPIIAPILLASTEKSRKRGGYIKMKKLEKWGTIMSILALLVATRR